VVDQDFPAIRRLMAARAKAVLSGNEEAFMATVDRQRPAFVDSQRVVFENLQELPITSLRYQVANYGVGNAPGITGGLLLSPPILEHIFFSGTDRRPMATGVAATFVKRSGHWLMAADTTDTGGNGVVTARPWDGPPIDVVVRGHLIVVADASAPGRAESIAESVTNDLAFDANILDVPTDDHLLVDATSSGGVSTFDNDDAAGAVTFAVSSTSGFDGGGRLAGMRVKLNPEYISELLSDPIILRHELTHFLMHQYSGLTPKWLTEGLAEYVAHQPGGLATEYMTIETYDRLMKRPQELTITGLFGMDPDTDYPLAMACVTYLVNNGGIDRVEDLMAAYVAHTDTIFNDQYTRVLLHRFYDMTPADVAHGAFDLLAALR
jgi:hypothetical protein